MHSRIDDRDELIDRYLNRKLSDVERASFEIMLMEDTQLFARVQLLDAFKRSLADERASFTGKRELFAMPFRSWLQQPLSLAASVLVAGLGLQVVFTGFSDEGDEAGVGIGSVFLVEATRGADTLSLRGAPPYLFQIDAGPAAAGSGFTASLRTAAGAELLQMPQLTSDAGGWVRFVYSQPLAGAYTVELTRLDAPAPMQSFTVEIND